MDIRSPNKGVLAHQSIFSVEQCCQNCEETQALVLTDLINLSYREHDGTSSENLSITLIIAVDTLVLQKHMITTWKAMGPKK